MKSFKIGLFVLGFVGSVGAYERPLNPDRFISLSLNTSVGKMSGDSVEVDGPSAALRRTYYGDTDVSMQSFGGGIRVPLSNSVTFDGKATLMNSETTFTREGNVYNQTTDLDGYQVSAELRFYLNK